MRLTPLNGSKISYLARPVIGERMLGAYAEYIDAMCIWHRETREADGRFITLRSAFGR